MITHPNVKLNLGLNVLSKREDGYHNLETLFIPYFGISDTLERVTGDDFSLTVAGLAGKPVAQAISPDGKLMITIAREGGVDWDPLNDLTAKAYFLLADEFDLPPIKIFLEKTSPVGAGLGGGSADAAFALRMISELAGLNLTAADLAAKAAKLGSDCAFFIYNRPMFATGRGEVLEPFEIDLSGYRIEVAVPEGVAVSTREAYAGLDGAIRSTTSLREALKLPVEQWKDAVVNDFERSVFPLYPAIAALKQQMYAKGAVYAAMTGSGSAVFGIFAK